jgi:predicted RNase H-like nuclease
VRQALAVRDDFGEALRINRASSCHRLGISKQCHCLFGKLAEVDEWFVADPGLQDRVREAHPEVTFQQMAAGRQLLHRKARVAGRNERLAVLEANGFVGLAELLSTARSADRAERVEAHDLLDAVGLCWTAWRIASSTAERLGGDLDPRGLRMEIWV